MLLLGALACTVALTACTPPGFPAPPAAAAITSVPGTQQLGRDVPTTTTALRPDQPAPDPDPALTASFEALQVRLGGEIGVAVAEVTAHPTQADVTQLGTLQTDVAWSTSKVPLAIAALRNDAFGPVESNVHAAITASDNAAAQRLWDSLGDGSGAGRAVDTALRSLGDTATVASTRRTRPDFTAFGQTRWSAGAQARVAAALACDVEPNARSVYTLLGQVEPGQAWGLGQRAGAHFKGGWGPDPSGSYLVRQMGVVVVSGQPVLGVSILAKPGDGSFASGVNQVDAVAGWLYDHLEAFPAGHC